MSLGEPVGMFQRRAAFTLVEMLVVVAIMAVMLGVLLPATSRAKEQSNRLSCQSQLRTISMAIAAYQHDFDGQLPHASFLPAPVHSSSSGPSLTMALIGRIRSTANVFQCPGDELSLYPICGISYFYHYTPARQDEASWPLLWDADDSQFSTAYGPLVVPRFHGQRNCLYADGQVRLVDGEELPFF